MWTREIVNKYDVYRRDETPNGKMRQLSLFGKQGENYSSSTSKISSV